MISSEKAFDMLPYAVDIFEKLNIKDYINKHSIASKGKNPEVIKNLQKEMGISLVMHIMKNSIKVKEEVFNIVALFSDSTFEEVKKQDFLKTIKVFKTIFEDEELKDFFKQAME